MTEPPPADYGPLTLLDLWEILRLPALFALIAIAGTWAVWYFTSMSCQPELAQTTGCNPSQIARYINLDALNKIATHAVIAASGGGLWSYIMITRERKAREAAEKAREAERKGREADREAAEKAREAYREAAEKQLAEERQKAAEEREQLLAVIETLAGRQNGNNGPVDPGSPEAT